MQISDRKDTVAVLDQLIAQAGLAPSGLRAWRALLMAHASLERRLATDLAQQTGLALGDYDVIAQLADVGGALRMTELAARAFSSRSNLTRRIERLVAEGLVRRARDEADARGVVVELTDAGVDRLIETVPVHLRGIEELFIAQLDDEELGMLEQALTKVARECSFG